MEHELRAEYVDGFSPEDADAVVKTWHVVREDEATGMCGRELSPAAATRSADDWGSVPVCHSCGALYLRESP
ncbi:hypothetical protein AF335_24750 [Streptomyces eurocidicus]|uniref:Uncharacterized protein n=1 Tax=Streptomyces eurocidicus TaxID=66423 RepID=A0A2N8NR65_STREU|nr:hypothetical protein [Streptomyces eurocidicus]MBB5117044.1 hypothetical protein [Streptomyces eurocidicus]MBF6052659.1 hypothetical protein [Streptomyces eurocidicus]PNE31254.1 hypothetical protein AF335_24750 [Streptomyces eurocidicus]